jgi:hypothetical protein
VKRTWGAALVAAIAAATLTGCGPATENQKPCNDFESTYNRLDVQNKRNIMKWDTEFRAGITELSSVASAGMQTASGDTKADLSAIVFNIGSYKKAEEITDAAQLAGNIFDYSAKLSKACADSGYPIHLDPEDPNS